MGQWPVAEGGQSGLVGAELGVHGPAEGQLGAILRPLPVLTTSCRARGVRRDAALVSAGAGQRQRVA